MRPASSRSLLAVLVAALILLACTVTTAARDPADLLFRGGAVYTVNAEQPWASAVAVDDGRIVFVGDDQAAAEWIGPDTEVIDLAGRMLLPGFHDSHMHPMRAGNRFLRCQMAGLGWPDEILTELRRCEKKLRPGQWLRGTDLSDDLFESDVLDKSYLDDIAPKRPAFITNHSGQLAWVNSKALQVAGIDASTPDPKGGEIIRDPDNNQPSGVLLFSAVGPIYREIPEPDETDLREALRLASRIANSFGITSSSEAQLYPENWQAYMAADQAGELTLRIQGSQAWEFADGLDQLDDIRQRRDAHNSPLFRADTVKLFLDGSFVGIHGAALLKPLTGTNDDFGNFYPASHQNLIDVVQAIDASGMNVHMHALGDRAVRSGLEAIENAIEMNKPWDRRHQIAHLALVHPNDLPRFSALGVTANYQALWAYRSEQRQTEMDAVGPERAQRLYAIRSMLDSGARVVLGSDWVSASMNPLYSIQIAVTRRPPDGSGPAWLPEQRISLEEAIAAYTLNGAWLAGHEQLTGSIETGKAADLVVLERNLFEVDPMLIKDVRVDLTLLAGRAVYRRTASQP